MPGCGYRTAMRPATPATRRGARVSGPEAATLPAAEAVARGKLILAGARLPAPRPSMADARPTPPHSRPTALGCRPVPKAVGRGPGRRTAVARARRNSTQRDSCQCRIAARARPGVCHGRAEVRARATPWLLADLLAVGGHPGRHGLPVLEDAGLIVPFDRDRLTALTSGRGRPLRGRRRTRRRAAVGHAG